MRHIITSCFLLGFFSVQVNAHDGIPNNMDYKAAVDFQSENLLRDMRKDIKYVSRLYREIERNFTQVIHGGEKKILKKKDEMLKVLARNYNVSEPLTEKEEHCVEESGYRLFIDGKLNDTNINNSLSLYLNKIHGCSAHMKENFTSVHLKALETVKREIEMDHNLLKGGILFTIEIKKQIELKGEMYNRKIHKCIDGVIDEFISSTKNKRRVFLKCMGIMMKSKESAHAGKEKVLTSNPCLDDTYEHCSNQLEERIVHHTSLFNKVRSNLTEEIARGKNQTMERKEIILRIFRSKYNDSKEHSGEKEELCIQESGFNLFREENSYNNGNNSLTPYWNRIEECSENFITNFVNVHLRVLRVVLLEVKMEPHCLLSAGIIYNLGTSMLIEQKGRLYVQKTRECIGKVVDEFSMSMIKKRRSFSQCMGFIQTLSND